MDALPRVSLGRQGLAGSTVSFDTAVVLRGADAVARLLRRAFVAAERDRTGAARLEFVQSAPGTGNGIDGGQAPGPKRHRAAAMNISLCIATYRRPQRLGALLDDL